MNENSNKNDNSCPSSSASNNSPREGTYGATLQDCGHSQDHDEKFDHTQPCESSMNIQCKDMTVDQNNIIVHQGQCNEVSNTEEIPMNYPQLPQEHTAYESKQEAFQRQDQQQEENSYQCIASSIAHYTDEEVSLVCEKLKNEDTFAEASSLLISWLEKRDCTKQNANAFFSMITSIQCRVKKLLDDKWKCEKQVSDAKKINDQLSRIFPQLIEDLDKIHNTAFVQNSFEQFTEVERKNIQVWKLELERMKLREELDILNCQLSALQNEIRYLHFEQKDELKCKNDEKNALLEMLQKRNKEIRNLARVIKILTDIKKLHEATEPELNGQSSNQHLKENGPEKAKDKIPSDTQENDTHLKNLIIPFLQPCGKNIHQICHYIHEIDSTIRSRDVINHLNKFSGIYKAESTGDGKIWCYAGFQI